MNQRSLLMKKVREEFHDFKTQMLKKSRNELFEQCNQIRFYHVIYEYFLYNKQLQSVVVIWCLKEEHLIVALYDLYLKYEELSVEDWNHINALLREFVWKNTRNISRNKIMK